MIEEYKKNFDAWNEYAKILDSSEFKGILHEGQVWWCAVGVNIGSEEDGKNEHFERPVLVFKKFGDDTSWIIPFTSNASGNKNPLLYTCVIHGTTETAKLSQLRLISNKRLLRNAGVILPNDFKKIRGLLASLI